ncbi:hypothetical protein Tco_1253003 [Tanacetum coccineum]
MDNPNITMEEYIRLEEERAQKRGETLNWQTARFVRIEHYYEDEYFTYFKAEFPAIVLGNTNTISSQGTKLKEYKAEKEDSEIEFPAIVLNDASTSDTTLSYEPTVSIPSNDDIDFRISFDESDDEDYTNNTKGSYELLKISLDKIGENFNIRDFIMELNVHVVTWNHLYNGIPLRLLKNLYVSFGIPFDPKRYYKDGAHTIIDVAKALAYNMVPLPPADQRHPWLRYQVAGYDQGIVRNYEQRLETIWGRSVNRVHVLDFNDLTPEMRQDLAVRLRMVYDGGDGQQVFVSHAWRSLFRIRAPLVREFILEFLSTCRMSDIEMGLDVVDTLCFQLGGVRRRMT